MSILQELLTLRESPEVPVELKDIVAAFPKHHGKAFEKLWGGRRLVWHGERFFDHDDLGPAYQKAIAAAEELINDNYETEVEMVIRAEQLVSSMSSGDSEDDQDEGAEDEDQDTDDQAPGSADFKWMAEFSDDKGGERQECYLGYDPVNDKLYIGFDAWISEENFNSDFDDAFEEAAGVPYDPDNEEHHDVFNALWQEYQSEGYGMWGLLFEITNTHGEYHAEEAFPPMSGGFYKGMRPQMSHLKNIIDLRLD